MSHANAGLLEFLQAFQTANVADRPGQVAAELVANRDTFLPIGAVAACRSIDQASFVHGIHTALEQDPCNLPALRLLAWHQIREAKWTSAKGTLQSLIKRWPEVPDVRRELARVGMMSPSSDGPDFLKLAASELHTRLAQLSYRCQTFVSRGEPIAADVVKELKLHLDQTLGRIVRQGAAIDGVTPRKSASVFLEVLSRIVAAPAVALVGNGPSLKGASLGAEIDAHDLVIRCNFPTLSAFTKDVGSKVDVVFFNESLVDILPDLLAHDTAYQRCLSLAFHTEPDAIFAVDLYEENMTERISRIPSVLREFYRGFFYTRSTTGMMGIILISVLLGKDLKIFGFDFYSDAAVHYYPSTSPVFLGHEVQYERWFLEHFLAWLGMGKVTVGSAGKTAPSPD